MPRDDLVELLATLLIFVGVFGLFFWYVRRVDRQMASRMSAEQRQRAREGRQRFMRGYWRAQAVFAAFVATMFGALVVALVREGYWQVGLIALPFVPLIIWGVVWAWRDAGGGRDE